MGEVQDPSVWQSAVWKETNRQLRGQTKHPPRPPTPSPWADGALNPWRILKAVHDRGGRLFCHHPENTLTHMKRRLRCLCLALSSFLWASLAHTLSSSIITPQMHTGALSAPFLPRRILSPVIFLPLIIHLT